MRSLLWGLVGFFLGGFLAGVVGFGLPSVISISQAEGSYAMQVAFFWVPLGAVLGAIIGFIARK
jgi:hypothetical protein